MYISKDAAWILAVALRNSIHTFADGRADSSERLFRALHVLEDKLIEGAEDQRRQGRTSFNEFSDCIDRYVDKHQPNC